MLWADKVTRQLGIAWSCQWFAMGVQQTVFVLSTSLRFGWGGTQNGAALAVVGIVSVTVQGLLARRAFAALGERRAAMGACLASAAAYFIFAVAPFGAWFFVAIFVQGFGTLANPAIRAMISAHAGPDRQGATMGALAAVEGLTAIGAPLISSALFRHFASPNASIVFPGAPFLLASAGFVLACAASGSLLWRKPADAAPQAMR